MDPVTGAIIGSTITGAASFFGGLSANSSAKSAAREQIEADRFNYKRRYQWQVQDMKKAGLNPLLAVSQGAPSVPGASAAQVPSNPAGEAASSALAYKRAHAEVKLLEEQAKKTLSENFESQYRAALIKRQSHGQDINNTLEALAIPGAANSARWLSSRSGKFFDALGRQIKSISPLK